MCFLHFFFKNDVLLLCFYQKKKQSIKTSSSFNWFIVSVPWTALVCLLGHVINNSSFKPHLLQNYPLLINWKISTTVGLTAFFFYLFQVWCRMTFLLEICNVNRSNTIQLVHSFSTMDSSNASFRTCHEQQFLHYSLCMNYPLLTWCL